MAAQADIVGIKRLVAAALDSPTGRVMGSLSTREAEPLKIMTRGEKPTRVVAQVLERFEDECGRVRLTFVQPDALRRDGVREELRYNLDMNVCRDGSAYVQPTMRDGPRSLLQSPSVPLVPVAAAATASTAAVAATAALPAHSPPQVSAPAKPVPNKARPVARDNVKQGDTQQQAPVRTRQKDAKTP